MHKSKSEHDSSAPMHDSHTTLRRLKRHTQIPIKGIQEVKDESNSDHQQKISSKKNEDWFEPGNKKDKKPLRRKTSKALSQVQSHSMPVSNPTKRYRKNQNQGNILVEEGRIKAIFKQICNPDSLITVDSLGHSLQKYHIDFDLRDISEMIGLLWMLREEPIPVEQEDRIEQDERGEFNISLRIDFKQFQQLFRMVRTKKL